MPKFLDNIEFYTEGYNTESLIINQETKSISLNEEWNKETVNLIIPYHEKDYPAEAPAKKKITDISRDIKKEKDEAIYKIGSLSEAGLNATNNLVQKGLNKLNSETQKNLKDINDAGTNWKETLGIDAFVNFKDSHNNIENGTGPDSLVQKYSGEVDETHFASSTTGNSDACLGEANKSSGKRNIISGKLNENAGSNNLVVGLRNNTSSNHNVVCGQDNINKGHDNLIGGSNNTVDGYDDVVAGNGNTVKGHANIVAAVKNTVNSNYSIVAGINNTVNNQFNVVAGESNKLSGDGQGNLVAGYKNILENVVNSIICGDNGDNDGLPIELLKSGIKAGRGLLNKSWIEGKALLGHYNEPKINTLVEVGNGTSNAYRENAFEVLEDGRIRIPNFDSNGNRIGMVTIKAVNGALQVTTYLAP